MGKIYKAQKLAKRSFQRCPACDEPTIKANLVDFKSVDDNHYGQICKQCAEDYTMAKKNMVGNTVTAFYNWYFVTSGRKYCYGRVGFVNEQEWIKSIYTDQIAGMMEYEYDYDEAISSVVDNLMDTHGDYCRQTTGA